MKLLHGHEVHSAMQPGSFVWWQVATELSGTGPKSAASCAVPRGSSGLGQQARLIRSELFLSQDALVPQTNRKFWATVRAWI